MTIYCQIYQKKVLIINYTPEGQLLTAVILATFKLNGLLLQVGDTMCAEFGLTSARWKVLGALLSTPERPMTVPQIARSMGQTRQAVQRLANEMVEQGLVAWQDNPDHKRAKLLTITVQGREVYEHLSERQIPWANFLGAQASAADLQTTWNVLCKLTTLLEKEVS